MIDSMTLAEVARKHGAGRFSLDDNIIPEIGFEVLVERGEEIKQGDEWLLFHHNEAIHVDDLTRLNESVIIEQQKSITHSRLIKTIY
jgi:thymidine phosphorylase